MKTWTEIYPGVNDIPLDYAGSMLDGNPSLDEIKALRQIILHTQARTVFEIGTFNGETAIALAALPGVQVWTLDLPEGVTPRLPVPAEDVRYLNAPKPAYPDNVMQLWGDSAAFDFSEYAGRCDVVFVDGAHSPEYIRHDIAVAQQLASEQGVVVLHAGTPPALEAVAGEYDLARITDRMALVLAVNERDEAPSVRDEAPSVRDEAPSVRDEAPHATRKRKA